MSEQTQTPAPSDYAAANAAAAADQGIGPVIAALAEAKITAVVENTGGWTMVATVTAPGGVVAVIEDGTDLYAVSQYRGDAWSEGEEEHGYAIVDGTEAMVAEVRRVVAELAAANEAGQS